MKMQTIRVFSHCQLIDYGQFKDIKSTIMSPTIYPIMGDLIHHWLISMDPSTDEFQAHLKRLEQAKERDHRRARGPHRRWCEADILGDPEDPGEEMLRRKFQQKPGLRKTNNQNVCFSFCLWFFRNVVQLPSAA